MSQQPCYPGVFTTERVRLNLWALPTHDPKNAIFGPNLSLAHIANSLSHICRFNGATPYHYSVGQHSLATLAYAKHVMGITAPDILRAVLLHDAVEAYTGDIIRPMKNHIVTAVRRAVKVYMDVAEEGNREAFKCAYEYLQCEDRIQRAIFDKYSATPDPAVTKADDALGFMECSFFFGEPEWDASQYDKRVYSLLNPMSDDMVYTNLFEAFEELNIKD